MSSFSAQILPLATTFFIALALTMVFTPAVQFFCRRRGLVALPSGSRWHKKETPIFGGVAILLGIVISLIPFNTMMWEPRFLGLLAGALIVFSVGLWDDIQSLGPVPKILGQIVAACIVVWSGVVFDFGDHRLLAILLTILWIVAVTNSFNLIDNMDGLCAGTACISGIVLIAWAFVISDPLVGLLSAALAGACLGFLRYNFSPASIFMGDCGSMLLGFSLSVASILITEKYLGNLVATLLVPVLVLGVPIFDSTFVSFTRYIRGQSIAKGGKDHASHRLVILGLSERRTVLLIYAFSLILGVTAFLYTYLNLSVLVVFSIVLLAGAVVFGLFLGDVKIEQSELPSVLAERKGDPPAVLLTNVFHKRSTVEMLLDLISICVAFYTATLLRYETHLTPERMQLFWQTLPVIIPIKLVTLYSFGLYRSMWRYLGIVDLIHIARAVTTASVFSVLAVLMLWRFEGFSRSVFVMDWLILLILAGGLRLLFRGLRETLPGIQKNSGRRVLIVGAGDAGEMLVREMLNNSRLGYLPVGFIDDNPGKLGRRMFGVEVIGARSDLQRLILEERIEEVIIAIPSALDEGLSEYFARCAELGVPCRKTQSLI